MATPHRYWRLRSPNTAIAGEYMAATEIQLRDVSGGSDLTGTGTASASATAGAPYVAANAVDNNMSTFWTTGGAAPPSDGHWWAYDFGAGNEKDIVEVLYTSRPDAFREDPLDLYIEFSDDGVIWIEKWSVLGMAAWTAAETRTWTEFASSSNARVSTFAVEVLADGTVSATPARVTTFSAEILHAGDSQARVSLFAAEVLRSVATLSSGRRRQIVNS